MVFAHRRQQFGTDRPGLGLDRVEPRKIAALEKGHRRQPLEMEQRRLRIVTALAAQHDVHRLGEAPAALAAHAVQRGREIGVEEVAEFPVVLLAVGQCLLDRRPQLRRQLLQRRRHRGHRAMRARGRMALALALQQAGAQDQGQQVAGVEHQRAPDRLRFRRFVALRHADHRQVDPLLLVAPVQLDQALQQAAGLVQRPVAVAQLRQGQQGAGMRWRPCQHPGPQVGGEPRLAILRGFLGLARQRHRLLITH
jgi:hypothetical protein